MLVLQEQLVQKISGLSEDHLQFLWGMIDRFMQPEIGEYRFWWQKQIVGASITETDKDKGKQSVFFIRT